MTALEWLRSSEIKEWMNLSNSQIQHYLKNKAIQISGKRPNWNEEIEFPVWQLIFFPNGNKITLQDKEEPQKL